MPCATPTFVDIQATSEIIRLLQQPDATQVSRVGTKEIDAIKQLPAIFKKPWPDKVSTTISSPRVPDKVTLAPYPRVPNKDSSSQSVAVHPQHCHPTWHNMGLPHQANSGIIIPSHWANTIIDPISGASMEYRHLVKIPKHRVPWTTSFSNKLGRL